MRRARTGIAMERVMTAHLWLHVCDALEGRPPDVLVSKGELPARPTIFALDWVRLFRRVVGKMRVKTRLQ